VAASWKNWKNYSKITAFNNISKSRIKESCHAQNIHKCHESEKKVVKLQKKLDEKPCRVIN